MAFTPKNWKNFVSGGTVIDASALVDLETRLSDYSTLQASLAGALNVALSPTSSSRNLITAGSATVTPIIVRGFVSQSVTLQEWQDSTGTAVASISAAGLSAAGAVSAGSVTATGAVSGASVAASGNATVGGTLAVTGVATGPTAAPGTNTTQLATTAFTTAAITAGQGTTSARVARSVLATGITNQTRAGRQLTVADFTGMGLSTPVGLFNLGSTTNLGSGGALVNKGAVTFAPGVTGTASEAAQFTGTTAQALYIADAGAADPFRIATGSVGCWFRTAKRSTTQMLVTKWGLAGANFGFQLAVAANVAEIDISTSGTTNGGFVVGVSDVCDDRWHFIVATHDGSTLRLYVDGSLESSTAAAGVIFPSAAPFSIGSRGSDGATTGDFPHFGRVDEAFVSADVLSLDQIRNLYAVRVPHTLATTPKSASVTVDRYKRGAVLASGDFPTQPVRGHNLNNVLTDFGSGGVSLALTGTGTSTPVAGPDGATAGAYYLAGTHTGLAATDTGLPSGTASRSSGVWFKTTVTGASCLVGWGTNGTADSRLVVGVAAGLVGHSNGADIISAGVGNDGQWHHAIVTEDNAPLDGVKRKLYLDGVLVAGSTVLNSVTLVGANGFRVGANPSGTAPLTGSLSRAFVTNYVLTPEQILSLYAKGSQALLASPKNAGDHIEGLDATYAYIIGDALQPQDRLNVSVMA
jgi:hypothetical protein